MTCAFAQVFVHNRTSDEKYWVEATEAGDVALELSDTYPGDTLDIWAEDVDRTRSPECRLAYVVPSEARVDEAVSVALANGDTEEVVKRIRQRPTAAHREILQRMARDAGDEEARDFLRTIEEELFANANQVQVHSTSRP